MQAMLKGFKMVAVLGNSKKKGHKKTLQSVLESEACKVLLIQCIHLLHEFFDPMFKLG